MPYLLILTLRNPTLVRIHGGCSSVGRAPDCGSGGRGFETHHPPQKFKKGQIAFFSVFNGSLLNTFSFYPCVEM